MHCARKLLALSMGLLAALEAAAQITFSTPTSLNVGNEPRPVRVVDVNGHPDALAVGGRPHLWSHERPSDRIDEF